MLVRVSMDSMGNVTMDPVSERVRRRIYKDMKENGYTGPETDVLVFGQEGGPAQELLDEIPPRRRKEVEEGYPVVVRMDDWTFRHLCGWCSD